MEITIILQWLAAWGLLLLAQSIFINGVYQSATGETIRLVDGTEKDSEMILYRFKKELTSTYRQKRKYIYDDKDNLLKVIKKTFPEIPVKYNNVYGVSDLSSDEMLIWHNHAEVIWRNLNVELYFGQYNYVEFYMYTDEYHVTKWIRKPLIECIKCMSSFWGALTFWPVVLFLLGFNWLEIPVFFADMFSLTYLNWILYKKTQ